MKPGSFTQLYIHLVMAVKYRDRLLHKAIRPEIFSYMSGILTQNGHKSININGSTDHVHILAGLNPNDKISDLIGRLKRGTSNFINQQDWFKNRFHWQNGYGAFSYSRSHLKNIYNYIDNQENHHKEYKFKYEYTQLLNKYTVNFNKKYLFDFFE